MTTLSAGLLLYRSEPALLVLLAHMGGPFWAGKDAGAWSIPKGEFDPSVESACDAARREFAEEIGSPAPDGELLDLGWVKTSGKQIACYAAAGDVDVSTVVSNTFELEWPPRSGRRQEFPEIDRAQWFGVDEAAGRIVGSQRVFLQRLVTALAGS